MEDETYGLYFVWMENKDNSFFSQTRADWRNAQQMINS